MKLDTLLMIREAKRLYEQLGFEKCSPYHDNTLTNFTCWKQEQDLTKTGRSFWFSTRT